MTMTFLLKTKVAKQYKTCIKRIACTRGMPSPYLVVASETCRLFVAEALEISAASSPEVEPIT